MSTRTKYLLAVLLVVLITAGYRYYAANRLLVDFDEPTYLRSALAYAGYLEAGQYQQVITSESEYEHPTLYKLLFGVALLPQNPAPNTQVAEYMLRRNSPDNAVLRWASPELSLVMADRYLSVFFGTLAVLALAVANPLAGFFLATQTLSVKYTSEIYLEALPLLTGLLCALAYERWFSNLSNPTPAAGRRDLLWLLASAVFLGMTAAGKYVYCVVGLGVLLHFVAALVQKQISWRNLGWLAGWGALSVLFFYAFDAYLWLSPWSQLVRTISFHMHLQDVGTLAAATDPEGAMPFWQPLLWLFSPASFVDLGPSAVFKLNLDLLIAALALIGAPRFFQKRRLYFYWFLAGLLFLISWAGKWPQYTLIILAPFCLAASEGVQTLWQAAQRIFPRASEPVAH